MALYRKYRPASFAEVVGQEHVTQPLSTALDSGRINHAYLFSGPRGCGKTSSARILARSLNCEQGPTSTPCGVCNSCVALAPGGPGNLDVTELDAASHGGVDDARELRDRAFYAPAESRYRVFIVDEAHMVTTQGFNALLKIVEEPPEHLIFIFATTEPEKVLTTIRSRTHHYPFRLLAPAVMRPLLEKICTSENVTVAPTVFPLVIRAGGGSPRDSLSVLDQLLAGAGAEGVTYQRALALLGVTDIALIDDAISALAQSDGARLFGAVESVMEAGHDPRRFAIDLLERLRDLILLNTVPGAADRGLVDAPVDVLEQMKLQAGAIGLAALTRFAETVHASLAEMRGTTSPRLLLEVMCARMLLPAASDSDGALLQRIEALERGVRAPARPADAGPAEPKFQRPSQRPADVAAVQTAAALAPAPSPEAPSSPPEAPSSAQEAQPRVETQPVPAPHPEPEPEPQPEPAGLTIDAIRRDWPKVQRGVGERSRVVGVMMADLTVEGVTGTQLTVSHKNQALTERLVEPHNLSVLEESVREVFAGPWTVVVGATERPQVRSEPKPAQQKPTYQRRSSQPPLPPEPDPEPEPEPEPVQSEEQMMADAAAEDAAGVENPAAQNARRDPDEIALELLQSELGARPLD